MLRKGIAILIVIAAIGLAGPRSAFTDPIPADANAQANPPVAPAPEASAAEGASEANAVESAPEIPPGTVINHSNWRQYQQYMSDGEIGLWEGKWFWKMPPDAQINVGPTIV